MCASNPSERCRSHNRPISHAIATAARARARRPRNERLHHTIQGARLGVACANLCSVIRTRLAAVRFAMHDFMALDLETGAARPGALTPYRRFAIAVTRTWVERAPLLFRERGATFAIESSTAQNAAIPLGCLQRDAQARTKHGHFQPVQMLNHCRCAEARCTTGCPVMECGDLTVDGAMLSATYCSFSQRWAQEAARPRVKMHNAMATLVPAATSN